MNNIERFPEENNDTPPWDVNPLEAEQDQMEVLKDLLTKKREEIEIKRLEGVDLDVLKNLEDEASVLAAQILMLEKVRKSAEGGSLENN